MVVQGWGTEQLTSERGRQPGQQGQMNSHCLNVSGLPDLPMEMAAAEGVSEPCVPSQGHPVEHGAKSLGRGSIEV